MTTSEHAYAQALLFAGPLEEVQKARLEVLCKSVEESLKHKLRPGLTPEDLRADYIAAVGLYGVAALEELEQRGEPKSFTASDLTIRREDAGVSVKCLRRQAEMLLAPYLCDSFSFRSV